MHSLWHFEVQGVLGDQDEIEWSWVSVQAGGALVLPRAGNGLGVAVRLNFDLKVYIETGLRKPYKTERLVVE